MRHTLLLLALATTAYAGSSWPQFRGPSGASAATGETPPAELDTAHHLLWQIAIPAGASSPIVVLDRAVVTGFQDGKLITLVVHLADGRVAWRHELTPEKLETYIEKLGSPAAPTCVSDGERIISCFGSHGLIAFDLEGKIVWEAKLPTAQSKDGFGTGSSPIIHEGLVYLVRDEDGPGQGLYAFDARTGAQVWKQSRQEFRVSYGTPVVWDGVLAVIGDSRAKGYDLKTGAERWLVRGLAAYPCTSPTVGADGHLYIATWSPGGAGDDPMPTFDDLLKMMDKDADNLISRAEMATTMFKDFFDVNDKNKDGFWQRAEWEGNLAWMKRGQNAVLALQPGGKGDITDTHVLWKSDKGAPYVASPLYYEGKLFLVKDGGFATLYDTATGKLLYEKQRLGVPGEYYASPAFAGGRIFLGTANGTLLVLDGLATDKPALLNKLELGDHLSASPAFADGKIFVRTKQKLFAFGSR